MLFSIMYFRRTPVKFFTATPTANSRKPLVEYSIQPKFVSSTFHSNFVSKLDYWERDTL